MLYNKFITLCDIRWYCTLHNRDTLLWRHDGRDGVSNHQPHEYLLNHLFRHRWQKTSKLRVTGLCEGNSPMAGKFLAQNASNAENVSIWWRHYVVTDAMASRAPDHPQDGSYLFRSINSFWRMISSEYGEIIQFILSWLCHTNAFALLALCERNQPVDSLRKWPVMLNVDVVLLLNKLTVKQTVTLPVIWDAMTLMCRH